MVRQLIKGNLLSGGESRLQDHGVVALEELLGGLEPVQSHLEEPLHHKLKSHGSMVNSEGELVYYIVLGVIIKQIVKDRIIVEFGAAGPDDLGHFVNDAAEGGVADDGEVVGAAALERGHLGEDLTRRASQSHHYSSFS
jgi:hypothetical protein